MTCITNIAAYKFAPLNGLKDLREDLLEWCKARHLRGTILLSTEGINLFIAGQDEPVHALLEKLRAVPGLEELEAKFSFNDHQPFNRMLVRIKKEIISFGIEGIEPGKRTSPKLKARELKQWLDEGRPVTLLDTRNDYEVKLGTFRNAIIPNIDTFRQFPDAVRKLPEELKDQPVVMFCTGGIRCEKAGPFMENEGFKHIYQLEGGILRYFEECGSAHYDGECFVFDQRVGVDPALEETGSAVCFACQTPLARHEQQDPRYVPGKSCPHCHQPDDAQRAARRIERQAALAKVCDPLPGSAPYDNHCPVRIPLRYDGGTLLDALCGLFPHVEREFWIDLCAMGKLLTPDGETAIADTIVRAGEIYQRFLPATVEPDVATDIRVLHEDDAVLVLHKPAPLPMHPSGRFNRNTLQWLVNAAWHPEKPRAVHRLDANTTGLVVFGRTSRYANLISRQFIDGAVEKLYLVRVHGHPVADDFENRESIARAASKFGTRVVDEDSGKEAHTRFKVLQRFADGTALLEAEPVTGRTNQIRIHLWSLGHAIVGDPTYLPDGQLGEGQTAGVAAAPMCLHAWKISFNHPSTRERVTFEALAPGWGKEVEN